MTRFVLPLALALVAGWCGTLFGGATASGSLTAIVVLLAVLASVGAPWKDPLGLGWAGRLLPFALWLAVAASWWASPVRRAGIVGLILLPAFLLLPAAFARLWRDEGRRRDGLRALAGVVVGVSLWSFGDALLRATPRAAMPVGHHTLLAAWLVILLPLAVLPARERSRWRALGWIAGLSGTCAVLASRSLLGTAALAIEGACGLGLLLHRRRIGWKRFSKAGAAALVLGGVAAVVLQGPRLERVLSGTDPSALARQVYLAAGWRGFLARPILGWGPGAAAWYNAPFLAPEPGVNPPGEAVGELHCLPVQLAFELGLPGLLLSLGLFMLFVLRRVVLRRATGLQEGRSADPPLLAASLLGLAGGAVASLGTASISVSALPWAAAAAAGAALGASFPPLPEEGGTMGEGGQGGEVPSRVYAALALVVLAPLLVAQARYDRALSEELAGDRKSAAADLERAVRLDPAFPLYRLRLALLRNDPEGALRAAQDGRGVAVLWTVAGVLGQTAQQPWARSALSAACRDDPMDPFAPFFQMQAEPGDLGAARRGAHALLAEPRLAAAEFWERHPGLLGEALASVRAWPGVDAGWKQALLTAVASRPAGGAGGRDWLALTFDTDPAESISILVFRRRPWPTQWPVVPLRRGLLAGLDLSPATALAASSPGAFAPSICVSTP